VAIALWNNTALETALTSLGLARADLIDAGTLRNFNLQMLLPVGPKPFEMLIQAPIEAIWQRPRRMAAAKLNLEQAIQGLIAGGMTLTKDVRLAHAALEMSEKGAAVAANAAKLSDRRLSNGWVSKSQQWNSKQQNPLSGRSVK